jgi:outer membrane lipopolysaccharide assembly protein LptE/RlpB
VVLDVGLRRILTENEGLRTRRSILMALAGAAAAISSGCGYQVAGKGDTLPTRAQTIAIPAFQNLTTRYRLTQWMPEALGMEFLRRSKYAVVEDVDTADMVLRGAIISQQISPLTVDSSTSRASLVQVYLRMQFLLQERATGKILYQNDNMEFRARYEIAVDQRAYFDESDSALERVSQDAARTVVSRILEGF